MSERTIAPYVVLLFDYVTWSRVFQLGRLSQYISFGVAGSCIIQDR